MSHESGCITLNNLSLAQEPLFPTVNIDEFYNGIDTEKGIPIKVVVTNPCGTCKRLIIVYIHVIGIADINLRVSGFGFSSATDGRRCVC
jgi:hypothetical protein